MNDKEEFMLRTRAYAVRAVRLVRSLPTTLDAQVFGKQLLRCSTSVAANYRAACRAKSRADFASKMKICEEEADESLFWLELMQDTGLVPADKMTLLIQEARELTAIITSICKTLNKEKRSK